MQRRQGMSDAMQFRKRMKERYKGIERGVGTNRYKDTNTTIQDDEDGGWNETEEVEGDEKNNQGEKSWVRKIKVTTSNGEKDTKNRGTSSTKLICNLVRILLQVFLEKVYASSRVLELMV